MKTLGLRGEVLASSERDKLYIAYHPARFSS